MNDDIDLDDAEPVFSKEIDTDILRKITSTDNMIKFWKSVRKEFKNIEYNYEQFIVETDYIFIHLYNLDMK